VEYILPITISGGVVGVIGGVLLFLRQKEITKLNSDLQTEKERRIIAEQKNCRIPELEQELKDKDNSISELQTEASNLKTQAATLNTKLEEQQKSFEEKEKLLKDAEAKLTETFKALSADALKSNNNQFLQLAKTNLEKYQSEAKGDLEKRQQAIQELVKPLKESLAGVDEKIGKIEKERVQTFSTLQEKIAALATSEAELKKETLNLVTALRRPSTRGRWGEIQLRRVVEMAGMVKYCDFDEQKSFSDDGRILRPDMVIQLPNERSVVVDAKTPLDAYLQSLEVTDNEQRIEKLKKHAGHVRSHIKSLSTKAYWDQFQQMPEFVVMFLPGEMFFSAALEQDPTLIEAGVEKKVILATPTTLIALLQAVAYGWKQEQIAKNALEISELGKLLYDRIRVLGEHFTGVGKGLKKALDSYNDTVRSFESRVMIAARKFKELGAGTGNDIDTIQPVDVTPRQLQAPEQLSDEVSLKSE